MNKDVKELKLKILETRAKIAAGREKNLKAAKKLRLELARMLSKSSHVQTEEKKEVKTK